MDTPFFGTLLLLDADIEASTATYFRGSSTLRFVVIFCRILFSVGVALLVAGGCLEGQYNTPNLSSVGLKLVKAGYIVVTVIFLTLLGFEAYFWANRVKLAQTGLLVSIDPFHQHFLSKVLMIMYYGIASQRSLCCYAFPCRAHRLCIPLGV